MDKIALVSVIIPTYKRSNILMRAIDSALAQTYKNLEVIVVDDNDAGTAYRAEVEKAMNKYKDDQRVKYIQHEKNKNGAAARNTGIRNSRGSYITFLDDDDFYYPEKVEKEVNYLNENKEYDGVYCGRIQKGDRILGQYYGDLSKQILTLTFTPTTPALMFRKSVLLDLNGFNEQFRRHQDFELLLRYFKHSSMGVVPEPLVEIGTNLGENELHGQELEKMKEDFFNLFRYEIEELETREKGVKKTIYSTHYARIFADHLDQKDFSRAIKIYFKGIRISFSQFHYHLFKYAQAYLRVKVKS
jgi:glycosyltransferase involved in cell wall biosynthesis